MKLHAHDVRRRGKGPFGRPRVAEHSVDEHVVRHLVPDGGPRCERILGVRDARERFIVDLQRLPGIERFGFGVRHDHCHCLADMARLVGRKQIVWAIEVRPAQRRV